MKKKLLQMITLLETFGDEKTIVNAARVSFGVHTTELLNY